MSTTSLNYLNGQNKTATYLWPFTSSSVTETHLLLTHSSRLPQIHENLFPLHGRKDMKMRTFNPMKDQPENTAPGFRMPVRVSISKPSALNVSIQDVILLIQFSTNDK